MANELLSVIWVTKLYQRLQSSPFYIKKQLIKFLQPFSMLKWQNPNLGFMLICLLSAFGSANLFANGCKKDSPQLVK